MSHETSELLLVLHESLTTDVAAFRLRLLGYEVDVVASAEQALTKLETTEPDMLIVDSNLPGISGLELIIRIRRDERTRNTPVLVCSGESSLDVVNKAFFSGADGYLLTPFDPAVLESKVESLLNERQGTLSKA